jgi:hypothetical protein
MSIDTAKVREPLDERDEIDQELASMFNGTKERKPQRCSKCGRAVAPKKENEDGPARGPFF